MNTVCIKTCKIVKSIDATIKTSYTVLYTFINKIKILIFY